MGTGGALRNAEEYITTNYALVMNGDSFVECDFRDYYNWHIDCQTYQNGWTRTVACIWYLNAVEEGGETEFAFGHKVVPSAGKLILFPATWNFPHRGLSPIKGNKYIITSFVLTNEETQHG